MTITATLRPQRPSRGGSAIDYVVDLAFSSTYPTGGDTFNLCAIAGLKTSKNRTVSEVWINNSNGYSMNYVKGTDATNGKIKILTAVNTELTAGAYPAQITGDTNLWAAIVLQSL